MKNIKGLEKISITVITIGAIVFNFWIYATAAQPWIISSLNILFHEAGHWIFFVFGDFIHALGGTLGEVMIPGIVTGHFYWRNNILGQLFGWWWLSTAFYSISIYASDARAMVLPLIGGPGGHDWFYMLGRLRLLDYDIFIGRIFVLLAITATGMMAWLLYRYWQLEKGRIIS